MWWRITGVCVRAILGMDWWGKGDKEVLCVCAEVNQGSCAVGSGCSSPATAGGDGGVAASGVLVAGVAYVPKLPAQKEERGVVMLTEGWNGLMRPCRVVGDEVRW